MNSILFPIFTQKDILLRYKFYLIIPSLANYINICKQIKRFTESANKVQTM